MADITATHGSATSVGAIFKEVYGEKIAEQTNRTAWIYNFFDKSTRRFGGKYWTVPAHFDGGQSVGSFNEGELVNDARAEVLTEMKILPKMHYAIITISGLAMAASKSNLHAFVSAKDLEVKNKTKWLISQMNANFYQAGRGVLGYILTGATSATQTINLTNSNTLPTNMNWFKVGMRIDIVDALTVTAKRTNSAPAKNVGAIITSVNKVTGAIVLAQGNGSVAAASIATTTGDLVTYEDALFPAPTNFGKHPAGLDLLVDDNTVTTTVQNISRSTYPDFQSTRMANGGVARSLSLDLMQQGIDSAEVGSGAVADFMIMGFGQRRNYLNLLWYDVRYGPQKLAGGFDVLKYNNLDVVVDKDCDRGRIYLGSQNAIKKYVVQPLGVLDSGGADMDRISHADTYELMLGAYMNVGIEQPNSWAKITDLIEP